MTALECRQCLMGGRWRVSRVANHEPVRPGAMFSRLADGWGGMVTIIDDDIAIEDDYRLRTHKQIKLRRGGSVQQLYLRHLVPENRNGWSGDGTVVQIGNEMHLCLGDDLPSVGKFACPTQAEHIVLQRIAGSRDCWRELESPPRRATWEPCDADPWIAERCRLQLMSGTWSIESARTKKQITYFGKHIGKRVTIAGDQFMFGEYTDEWVTQKQITFVPGGQIAQFDLLHDVRRSLGWSSSALATLDGDVMRLCFMQVLPHLPRTFECSASDELVVLRRSEIVE